MNWDRIKGKWGTFKGRAKEKWDRLSNDDLEVIKGKRDLLVGKLREVYGLAKKEAERQVSEFGRTAGSAVAGVAGKAKRSGKVALSAAKKAGRAALGLALDAASAGLDKVRGLMTRESKKGKTVSRASQGRARRKKARGTGASQGKKRLQPRRKTPG
jgi:uncharacterized protein YjbJ (UPF0337 family)